MLLALAWSFEGEDGAAELSKIVSLDVNGDGFQDIAAAAPLFDVDDVFFPNTGRIYTFLGSAVGVETAPSWTYTPRIASARAGDRLASADVNADGFDDLIVEAEDANIFFGSASGLGTGPDWIGPEAVSDIASAGDVNGDGFDDVIVGDSTFDASAIDTGRATLFLGSGTGPGTLESWSIDGMVEDDSLGDAVSSAGDVNGDGFDDVVVGATNATAAVAEEGVALLFLGSATGPSLTPDWVVGGGTVDAEFGHEFEAGDLDGDGFGDLLVESDDVDVSVSERVERVSLFLGEPTGLGSSAVWMIDVDEGESKSDTFAAPGDINADGFADIVLGMGSHDDGAREDVGSVDIYLGSATGFALVPSETILGVQDDSQFGGDLAAAFDVDGDGSGDLLVGAYEYNAGPPTNLEKNDREGKVYLYIGGCVDGGILPFDDADGDTVADRCDRCSGFDDLLDADGDTVPDDCDVCPDIFDLEQADSDADGQGDLCDPIVITSVLASKTNGLSVVIDDARPGEDILVVMQGGPIEVDGGPCPGAIAPVCLDLGPGPTLKFQVVADDTGHAELTGGQIPAGAPLGATLTVQAAVVRGGEVGIESNPVEVTLDP